MRLHLLQLGLIVALMVGGLSTYTRFTRLDTSALERAQRGWIEAHFGPRAVAAPARFDAAFGIEVGDLAAPRLRASDGGEPGLRVDRLQVHLDPAALVCGRVAIDRVVVQGAGVHVRETIGGIEPDFELHLDPGPGDQPLPPIEVRDARVHVQARSGSERLASGARLTVAARRLALTPTAEGPLDIEGVLHPVDLDQPDARITVEGHVDPATDAFALEARWDPLDLTPPLLDVLAEDVAAPLRQESIRSGSLTLHLLRAAGATDREVQLRAEWASEVNVQVQDLPGTLYFDAKTREQLAELFGRGALSVQFDEGRFEIDQLFSELAGGEVSASGWIEQETGALELDFTIRGLSLEDPAVVRALGEEGRALYAQFDPSGIVDAIGRVTKQPGGELDWQVDVVLEAASFRFIGEREPDGRYDGFPYRVEDATGRIRLRSDGVWFDEIVGFNRGAEARILGHKGRTWNDSPRGTETGRVRFGGKGPDVRLTVVAENVPMDERMEEAIQGSLFADVMDQFVLEGVIDRIEIDILAYPDVDDSANTEVRITLEGEQFRYKPFPLPLEDVRGTITMTRPFLPDGRRGRVYAFDVEGWTDGARVRVWAEILDHDRLGRLFVSAAELPLDGRLAAVVGGAELTRGELAPVWRWLGPAGLADVEAGFPLLDDPRPIAMRARLREADISLDAANAPTPVKLEKLTGEIRIDGNRLQLVEVAGELAGAAVTVEGTFAGGTEGSWDVRLRTERLAVTEALLEGVRHLADTDALLPGGMRIDDGSEAQLDVRLTKPPGTTLEPAAVVRATDIAGRVRLPGGGAATVRAREVRLQDGVLTCEELRVAVPGLAVRVPRGRVVLAERPDLAGRFELRLDGHRPAELIDLLPEDVRALLRGWARGRRLSSDDLVVEVTEAGTVRLDGGLTFVVEDARHPGPAGTVRFEGVRLAPAAEAGHDVLAGALVLEGFTWDTALPVADLTGRIEIEQLQLGPDGHGSGRLVAVAGRIARLPFRDLGASLRWRDRVLAVDGAVASVADGQVRGRLLLHTDRPTAYEGQLEVTGVLLEQVVAAVADRPPQPPYRGRLDATVAFENRSGRNDGLKARGRVRVQDGDLGEMPAVASIFTLFSDTFGGVPNPRFREADLVWSFFDETFHFARIEVRGPGFVLPGRGTVTMDGLADLTFAPDAIKNLLLPGVMQAPGFRAALRRLLPERGLYVVRLRGPLDSASPQVVAFPRR